MDSRFGTEALRAHAVQALAERQCATVEVANQVSVFLDCLAPDAKLLICGAGHIAMPLAQF